MSVQTTTRIAELPSVNLIPPEIQEERNFRRLQAGLAAIVVLAIAGVGALYVHDRKAVHQGQAELAAAQETQQRLQREMNGLRDVTETANQLQAAENALTQVRSTNVRWSDTLADLSASLPDGVWYTSLGIKETVQPGAYPKSTAVPLEVGTIQFGATGYVHKQVDGWPVHNVVAGWLDAMSKIVYFSDAMFSTSQEDTVGTTPVVNFSSTVTVTNGAIKGCDKPGVC